MKNLLKLLSVAALVVLGPLVAQAEFNSSGGGTYNLQASISSSQTSILLSSFTEPSSGIPYTMSYIDTNVVYATINPDSANSEFISFTGITQNANGTALLTGVTRGLSRTPGTGGCVASSTLAHAFPGQSRVIMSAPPCFFSQYVSKQNEETITGMLSGPTPTAAANYATKQYVDNVVSGGTVATDRIIVAATAGTTITQGQIVYFDYFQDEWMLADADVAASSTNVLLAVAQGSGTNGNLISGGVLLLGLDSTNVGGTQGNLVYLSNTAGATSTSPGTVSRAIGVIRTSSSFYFDPYFVESVSATGNNTLSGNNIFTGTNSFTTATTSFTATTTMATSTTYIGSFPAYEIGKNKQIYTTNGTSTFAIPSGVKKLWVEVIGPGGAGGAGTGGDDAAGSGGGGGGYAQEIVDVSATTSVQVRVGTGVSDWSTFGTNGFYLYATAGQNGTTNLGAGGAGGCGFGGDINFCGEQGGFGIADGTAGPMSAGKGGSTPYGSGGGQSGNWPDFSGASGSGCGAGGGGGGQGGSSGGGGGGSGTDGCVIIRW